MPRRHWRGALLRHFAAIVTARRAAIAWLLMVTLAGCAGTTSQAPVRKGPANKANQAAIAKASGARKVRLDAPVRVQAPGPPTLQRGALARVLGKGPGALLQHVPLKPVFSSGQRRRFVGFAIARVFDNSPKVLRYGIKPGDMLRSINGIAVSTPDQLMAVFKQLAHATVVRVSVVRNGTRMDFAWPVVEPNSAPERKTAGSP